jgi:hypothetical protein
MSPDEPSLSDHEQRILAEIERNLAQEDPDFVRNVSEVRPKRDTSKLLRVSVLGLVIGLPLLFLYIVDPFLGTLGFLVMLASIVGIVSSVRNMTNVGSSPNSVFRDALRRAEERMRPKRPEQ